MAELYTKAPRLAIQVLNDILADGEPAELLVILRQLTVAFGGVRSVANAAHLNPTQLYRTLSTHGNPSLRTLTAVLRIMGLQFAVQPLAPRPTRRPAKRRKPRARV